LSPESATQASISGAWQTERTKGVDHAADGTKDHALPVVRYPGRRSSEIYASVFESSKIGKISRYGKEGFEIHGKTAGTVMTVEFEIEG
jgi:hypothetical protein